MIVDIDPHVIRYTAAAILAAGAVWAAGYYFGKRAVAGSKGMDLRGIHPVLPLGIRRHRPRRPIVRAVVLSLVVHAALVVIFSAYVVSEAVYRAVKMPERQEVTLQADTLARERLALGIRESSPSLPPPAFPETTAKAPPVERLPLPEIPLRELAQTAPAPSAAWSAADPQPSVADLRFYPDRLPAALMSAASPALPEIRLDEPEPATATSTPPPSAEPAPALASKPLGVSIDDLAGPPAELPPFQTPPAAELNTGALEVLPESSLPAAMKIAALPALREFSEPALPLESRSFPADRYLLRDPKIRSKALQELGGSPETEAAIERALRWLVRHQEADGRWKIDRFGGQAGHDVAATSLASLAFLAWGADPAAGDEFGKAAARSLDWLVQRVADDGDLRHEPGNPAGDMYDQGMGGIALAEAFALTGDNRFRAPAERVIGFILAAQNKGDGGWRYRPGEGGDTSVFGWQVMALGSASLAGIEVPEENMSHARRWLEQVGGGKHGGEYGYQNRSPKPAMVAEGMFSAQLLDNGAAGSSSGADHLKMEESADYLQKHLPNTNERDFYYWYYGALALYQHQGPVWEEWNTRLRPILLESQRRGGDDDGSWDPNSRWGGQAGRAVVTALAALSLEVYYRYLPLHSPR